LTLISSGTTLLVNEQKKKRQQQKQPQTKEKTKQNQKAHGQLLIHSCKLLNHCTQNDFELLAREKNRGLELSVNSLFSHGLLFRYDVMLQCWRERPEDRPTFKDLYKALHSMIHEKLVCTLKNDKK